MRMTLYCMSVDTTSAMSRGLCDGAGSVPRSLSSADEGRAAAACSVSQSVNSRLSLSVHVVLLSVIALT